MLDAAAFEGERRSPPADTHRTTPTLGDYLRVRRSPPRLASTPLFLLKTLFWGSLAALAWTHVAYPAAAVAAARLRPRPVRKGGELPTVSVIVAAHDEEAVIERRLENLLALDYPEEQLEIVVASDASTDATDELVERDRRPRAARPAPPLPARRQGRRPEPRRARDERRDRRVLRRERDLGAAGAAQSSSATSPTPTSRTSAGSSASSDADGTNREGAYWRYELERARGRVAARTPSPAATARSTPCAARTTSTSTRASATTSRSRT